MYEDDMMSEEAHQVSTQSVRKPVRCSFVKLVYRRQVVFGDIPGNSWPHELVGPREWGGGGGGGATTPKHCTVTTAEWTWQWSFFYYLYSAILRFPADPVCCRRMRPWIGYWLYTAPFGCPPLRGYSQLLYKKKRINNKLHIVSLTLTETTVNVSGTIDNLLCIYLLLPTCPTEKSGAILTRVRVPGVARDFSPRVNFQCRLSCGVRTAPALHLYAR